MNNNKTKYHIRSHSMTFDHTTNIILNILIKLQFEILFLIFFCIIAKPVIFFIIVLKYIFYLFNLLISYYNRNSLYSFVYYFNLIFIIKLFSLIHSEEEGYDAYNSYKKYLLIISAGLLTGVSSYIILDKTVNLMGDKFIESGLLTEEKQKFIRDMQNVPFKFDVFAISVIIGSAIAYLVSQQLN